MRKFLLSFIIVLIMATSCFAQNGLINEDQIAYPTENIFTAGESFSDQELAYLDTSSNTIKKLITGVYKSYEVNIHPLGTPQIRTAPCGTNEVVFVGVIYSSPNLILHTYYINNDNPEYPIVVKSGTLSFSTGTAQTYYEAVYVGDNTAYFFYMKSDTSFYCRPITNIKTENGAILGDELYLFDSALGHVGSAYYDPVNDKILMSNSQSSGGYYCVISSPKSSPVVTTFNASYASYHTAGHTLSIGNNKALFFYADSSRIFAECITNLDTTPATTSKRTYKSLYATLTAIVYKSAYTVYLGNNKGAVFVTEADSPYKVWGVPFIIVDDIVIFGDAALVSSGMEGSNMQWVSAVAIGSDVMAVLTTDSVGKLVVTYVYYISNKLYTSSYGINIYGLSIIYQCFLIYLGNNSLAVIVSGSSDMIVLNNIMPYYNTDPTNINKYMVLGSYKTNEIALCKALPKKIYSYNYSSYINDGLNQSLFIGPTNKHTPYRTIVPSSFNIENTGNTYYPIMPPSDSAFGDKYVLDTIGTILQSNLKNIKGF